MKKNYLLPHVCQRTGKGLLLAALLLLAGHFAVCMYAAFSQTPGADAILSPASLFMRYSHNVFSFTLGAGILLTAFSCERCEDEMIASVRKDSLVSVAYIAFLLYLLLWLFRSLLSTDYIVQGNRVSPVGDLMQTIGQPLLLFILYETVFRLRLSKLKKAMRDEE